MLSRMLRAGIISVSIFLFMLPICRADVLFPDVTVSIAFKEARQGDTDLAELVQALRDRAGHICEALEQSVLRECHVPDIQAPTREFHIGTRVQYDFHVPLTLGAPINSTPNSQPYSGDFFDARVTLRQIIPADTDLSENRDKEKAKQEYSSLCGRIAKTFGRQCELWDFREVNANGQNSSLEVVGDGLISTSDGKIFHPLVMKSNIH